MHASNMPDIEDYQRRVPPIENSKVTFPKASFGSKTPEQMKVVKASRWQEHYSPLGNRMSGIQPYSNQITPKVNQYEVRKFEQKNFGQWGGQNQKYFHRNLGRRTEMKLVSKYQNASVADLSFGAGLPSEFAMKDMLDSATLKDLNRFTPMRNSARGGNAVPRVRAGSGQVPAN